MVIAAQMIKFVLYFIEAHELKDITNSKPMSINGGEVSLGSGFRNETY